jgi:hypothetical protein
MTAARDHDRLRTFHSVKLRLDDADATMSYDEFMAIPLDRRIRLLLTGRPKFFRDGAEISRHEALRLSR